MNGVVNKIQVDTSFCLQVILVGSLGASYTFTLQIYCGTLSKIA